MVWESLVQEWGKGQGGGDMVSSWTLLAELTEEGHTAADAVFRWQTKEC
jgi:hypothetical protein